LRIYEVIWKEQFVDKIESRHQIKVKEVEEVLFSNTLFRKAQKGRIKDENLYIAYSQTESGRYLVVFFVYKKRKAALPISAREMTPSERNYYEKEK